jgi:hypothetical protein
VDCITKENNYAKKVFKILKEPQKCEMVKCSSLNAIIAQIQNCPFRVNTTNELQNTTKTKLN